jgi:hypothetical protein
MTRDGVLLAPFGLHLGRAGARSNSPQPFALSLLQGCPCLRSKEEDEDRASTGSARTETWAAPELFGGFFAWSVEQGLEVGAGVGARFLHHFFLLARDERSPGSPLVLSSATISPPLSPPSGAKSKIQPAALMICGRYSIPPAALTGHPSPCGRARLVADEADGFVLERGRHAVAALERAEEQRHPSDQPGEDILLHIAEGEDGILVTMGDVDALSGIEALREFGHAGREGDHHAEQIRMMRADRQRVAGAVRKAAKRRARGIDGDAALQFGKRGADAGKIDRKGGGELT